MIFADFINIFISKSDMYFYETKQPCLYAYKKPDHVGKEIFQYFFGTTCRQGE